LAIVDVPRSDIIIRAHATGKAVLARARESIRWHCKLCGKIFAEMIVRIVAGRVAHERARFYALGSVEARPRRALIDVDIAVDTAESIHTRANVAVLTEVDRSR
jgi:hypothetical protein